MWYYMIQGNNSQVLHKSTAAYRTERAAKLAGQKLALYLAPTLGIVLTLHAGREEATLSS